MSKPVISVENLSKTYQLGVIGTGTFKGDVQSWLSKLRGLPDPNLKIGENGPRQSPGRNHLGVEGYQFAGAAGRGPGHHRT